MRFIYIVIICCISGSYSSFTKIYSTGGTRTHFNPPRIRPRHYFGTYRHSFVKAISADQIHTKKEDISDVKDVSDTEKNEKHEKRGGKSLAQFKMNNFPDMKMDMFPVMNFQTMSMVDAMKSPGMSGMPQPNRNGQMKSNTGQNYNNNYNSAPNKNSYSMNKYPSTNNKQKSQPVKSMQRDKYGNVAVNVMGSGRQDAMAFASDGGDSRDMAQQMAKMQAEMDAMMGR